MIEWHWNDGNERGMIGWQWNDIEKWNSIGMASNDTGMERNDVIVTKWARNDWMILNLLEWERNDRMTWKMWNSIGMFSNDTGMASEWW